MRQDGDTMVKLQLCKGCGRFNYPFKGRCSCGSTSFDYVDIDLEGTLLVTTKIYVTPRGFAPPLLVGLVETPYLKVLVRLNEELPLGSRVKILQDSNGALIGQRLDANSSSS